MTLLVGLDGAGWTPTDTNTASNGGSAIWRAAGHVAVASGTASSAKVYIADWVAASAGRIYVYSAADALLATSAALADTDGTGLLTAALSLAITLGVTYKLVFRPDIGYPVLRTNSAGGTFACDQHVMAATFPTGDATLTTGTSTASQDFIIWLDGTAGGGGSVPRAMLLGVG